MISVDNSTTELTHGWSILVVVVRLQLSPHGKNYWTDQMSCQICTDWIFHSLVHSHMRCNCWLWLYFADCIICADILWLTLPLTTNFHIRKLVLVRCQINVVTLMRFNGYLQFIEMKRPSWASLQNDDELFLISMLYNCNSDDSVAIPYILISRICRSKLFPICFELSWYLILKWRSFFFKLLLKYECWIRWWYNVSRISDMNKRTILFLSRFTSSSENGSWWLLAIIKNEMRNPITTDNKISLVRRLLEKNKRSDYSSILENKSSLNHLGWP